MNLGIKKLKFSYDTKTIIDNISFTSNSKSIGLLGPNGSGKTTLIKLIAGLLKSEEGTIFLDERDISFFNQKELSKIIAFVSQDYEPTFGFNVEEVIEMGRYPYLGKFGFVTKEDKKIIDKIVELLSLKSLKKTKTDELSSGEKQKVRFARALVQEPKYILLDEPTSNLDLTNKLLALNVIREIIDFGTNIILTSHDLNFIRESTNDCLMLFEGNILSSGSTKKILTKDNIKKLFKLNSLPNWIY